MIDLHIHILPGMDDGSPYMEESLEMARIAVKSGTTELAVTPHSYADGRDYFMYTYDDVYSSFESELKKEHIKLKIHPGMEILAFPDMVKLLDAGVLKTINNTKYALVEFKFHEEEELIRDYLSEMIAAGYKPIVAHLERYEAVQENELFAFDMADMGCVLQMNKGSIAGKFGQRAEKAAWRMLDQKLINIVASDAHRSDVRTPALDGAARVIESEYSKQMRDVLFEKNPERILAGQGIARFKTERPKSAPEQPAKKKRRRLFF